MNFFLISFIFLGFFFGLESAESSSQQIHQFSSFSSWWKPSAKTTVCVAGGAFCLGGIFIYMKKTYATEKDAENRAEKVVNEMQIVFRNEIKNLGKEFRTVEVESNAISQKLEQLRCKIKENNANQADRLRSLNSNSKQILEEISSLKTNQQSMGEKIDKLYETLETLSQVNSNSTIAAENSSASSANYNHYLD